MVNPSVDGYIKTPNQQKIVGKMQKDDTVLKTCWKDTKMKYKLCGGGCLHLAGQGSRSLFPPISYSIAANTLKYWLNKK